MRPTVFHNEIMDIQSSARPDIEYTRDVVAADDDEIIAINSNVSGDGYRVANGDRMWGRAAVEHH